MQRANVILAVVLLALIAFLFIGAFAGGLFAFRTDSFYHLKGESQIIDGSLVVSFGAIRCPDNGQKYWIPGALPPNEKANGFQVAWELKGDSKRKITVEDIRAELLDGSVVKPLDVPFNYWDGEFNAAKNFHYAFISTGGYHAELPLGVYHIRLSYILNGIPYSKDVTLDYVVERKFGFHGPFTSTYY